jgi:hypothetical protein
MNKDDFALVFIDKKQTAPQMKSLTADGAILVLFFNNKRNYWLAVGVPADQRRTTSPMLESQIAALKIEKTQDSRIAWTKRSLSKMTFDGIIDTSSEPVLENDSHEHMYSVEGTNLYPSLRRKISLFVLSIQCR